MEYKIFGSDLPGVSVKLDAGESMYTQTSGMAWMEDGIDMSTNMKGGFLKGIGRKLAGESMFMATYTSNRSGAEIVFAASLPGRVIDVDIAPGKEIIAQKTAFLCGQPSVEISVEFTKRFSAGAFGGEGFILQRLSGNGKAFLEACGTVVEKELAHGETIKVDTGNVVAFESGAKYEIETVKGFKNIMFGGEGLFLTRLTGPGKVWLQTMTVQNFANRIIPFIPAQGNR